MLSQTTLQVKSRSDSRNSKLTFKCLSAFWRMLWSILLHWYLISLQWRDLKIFLNTFPEETNLWLRDTVISGGISCDHQTSSLDCKFIHIAPVFLAEVGGYWTWCEIKFAIFFSCTSRCFQLVYTDSKTCCEVKVRSNTPQPLGGIVCDLEEYARPTQANHCQSDHTTERTGSGRTSPTVIRKELC